jgi:hypothetical protein
MPVAVATIEDIMSTFAGYDSAETVRNGIIDAYQQWSTLEYVVLGGDDEYLPHRGLCFIGYGENETDIPADLYYAALDGNWDLNGNHIYGEPFEDDLVAELAVGRFAVDSPVEIANMINKSLTYSTSPVDADLENALMVGEDLGWVVWGGDSKDEIMNGSSNWGYTTVGLPSNFDVVTLYDRNGIWDPHTHLLPLLNSGVHFVNHLGHSSNSYNMKLNRGEINSNNILNNGSNHLFYIPYSQGCYSAAFDNRNSWGSHESEDCIAEAWTTLGNGAVAYIGNSRYGWGDISCTNGSSQRFDREFFDALFGEGITRLGWTNGDSKEDVIYYIDSTVVRYVYYCINILGDPTIDLWTAAPQNLQPILPDEILEYQNQLVVDVPGVADATVAVSHQGELIGIGETDGNGHVSIALDPPPVGLDPAVFVITAHNYHYFEDSVDVIPQQGAYVIVSDYSVDDSQGNNDGELDYAETISLGVTFENVGILEAQGLTAELSSDIRNVIPVVSSVDIGSIPVGESVNIEDAFSFRVNPMIADQAPVTLVITIRDSQDSIWVRNIYLTGHAPDIVVELINVNEEGYRHLEVGETVNMHAIIGNQGSSPSPTGQLILATDTPLITVTTNTASIASIVPGSSNMTSTPFVVEVSPSCPDPASVIFYFTLADSSIQYYGHTLTQMYVGEFFNNVEAGEGNWPHEPSQPGFGDQWHRSTLRNHSPYGQYSWKCGALDSSGYSPGLDAALTTHEFQLTENMVLMFWHWLDAEISETYVGRCYDGGIVEICQDDTNWTQIDPVGGYHYLIRNEGQSPFPSFTPVLSGSHGWERIWYDLSDYSGSVRLRFRFGSNGSGDNEGWYIDDIEIRPFQFPIPPTDLTAELHWSRVDLNWMYAGNGLDEENEVSFNVYRNSMKIDSCIEFHAYIDYLDNLEPGSYDYFVTAQVGSQESTPSNEVEVYYNGEIVSEKDNPLIPKEYELSQNYPNPFNATTTFRYAIPTSGFVRLAICNIMGQKVATLVEGRLDAGYHAVVWESVDLASGLYFCRLQAEGHTLAKKLVLLK